MATVKLYWFFTRVFSPGRQYLLMKKITYITDVMKKNCIPYAVNPEIVKITLKVN